MGNQVIDKLVSDVREALKTNREQMNKLQSEKEALENVIRVISQVAPQVFAFESVKNVKTEKTRSYDDVLSHSNLRQNCLPRTVVECLKKGLLRPDKNGNIYSGDILTIANACHPNLALPQVSVWQAMNRVAQVLRWVPVRQGSGGSHQPNYIHNPDFD